MKLHRNKPTVAWMAAMLLTATALFGCDPGPRVNQLRMSNELAIPVLVAALGGPEGDTDPPAPVPITRQLGVVHAGETRDFDLLVNHFQVFTLNHKLIAEAATELYPLQNFTWDVSLSSDTKGNVLITYPKDIQEDRQWILWLAIAIPLTWLGYRQEKRRLKMSRAGAKTQMRIQVDHGGGGKQPHRPKVQPGVPDSGETKKVVSWETAMRHPDDRRGDGLG